MEFTLNSCKKLAAFALVALALTSFAGPAMAQCPPGTQCSAVTYSTGYSYAQSYAWQPRLVYAQPVTYTYAYAPAPPTQAVTYTYAPAPPVRTVSYAPAPPAYAPAPPTPAPAPPVYGDAYGFTSWLNATRASYGLPPVGYDANLSAWAAANSSRGFAHTVMGPARRQNVGSGGFAGVCAMWMADAPHRAALLDPSITHVGIALVGSVWTMNGY